MYNLTEYLENSTNNSLTLEQVEKVKKAEQYLQKHKIHEICNVFSDDTLGISRQAY